LDYTERHVVGVCPSIAQEAIKDNLAVVRPSEFKGDSRSGNCEVENLLIFVASGYVDRIASKHVA
jgi:hypothetical protein